MDKQNSLEYESFVGYKPNPGDAPLHMLIPVSFASDDRHTLAYAARVAATHNGQIHLFHITDLMHLPEFENPLAVRSWLREVRTEAMICLKSFKDVIEKWGAKVFTAESSIGNTSFLLQQKVEDLIPDLIIVGQDSLRGHVLSKLTKRVPCPVLIVPKAIHNSMIYVQVHKKRAKIDSLDLFHNCSVEKWSLN